MLGLSPALGYLWQETDQGSRDAGIFNSNAAPGLRGSYFLPTNNNNSQATGAYLPCSTWRIASLKQRSFPIFQSPQVMSKYRLPSAALIPALPTDGRVKVLAHLFEPCDALNTLALEYLAEGPFENYNEVITLVWQLLIDLKDTESPSNAAWLLKILAAHPRLGAKKVDSEHSKLEQASLTAGSEEEAIKLKTLNKQYEDKFPGLRYVVFVNGRSRATIMEDMERRIARGDFEAEKTEAINAMCDIARDRVDKLLT